MTGVLQKGKPRKYVNGKLQNILVVFTVYTK